MLRSSQAPQAVASVRDILSRQENLPRALSRLGQHASHQRTLDHNPPQPTKRSLDPLTGNLASREFTYPERLRGRPAAPAPGH